MAPKLLNYCLAVVRWTPVVFIVSVIVWSYYAYVVQMCLFTIENKAEKALYLILFHPIIGIFLWTYWRTIFTDPGRVPKEFHLSRSDINRYEIAETTEAQNEILSRLARNLSIQCRTSSGGYRYCEKCKAIKPDRAHHCSVCGMCVLKMDHHCPWVNNCVNFTNYKFFVLFLGWGLIYCLYVAATSAKYFVKFWSNLQDDMNNLHIVFLFFAGIMFAISLVSLFGYHLYLTAVNRSTLESFRAPIFRSGPDKDGFSLGRAANFQEIFGDDRKQYVIPTFSSFGDGITYPIRTVDEDYDQLLGDRQRWMEEGEGDQDGDGLNTGLQLQQPEQNGDLPSSDAALQYGSTTEQHSSVFLHSEES